MRNNYQRSARKLKLSSFGHRLKEQVEFTLLILAFMKSMMIMERNHLRE